MGGRGSSGSRVSAKGEAPKKSVFGKETPKELEMMYNTKRSYRDMEIYEASQVSADEIKIGYATADEYEQVSTSFQKRTYRLPQGIYANAKRKDEDAYESHNINWDAVRTVSGKTYDISGFLRKKGYKWNREIRAWVKD